jgi:methionine synthase II (cobalamin-independent)
MPYQFEASCRSLLIGSLPLEDHGAASELVFRYTPEIPLWVQLPVHAHEGMMQQFLPGLPGLRSAVDRTYVDTSAPDFDNEVLAFYEEFVAVTEGGADIDHTRFALGADVAPGFAVLMEQLADRPEVPVAVKGQVTGPFTFCTGVHDETRQAIFYNPQLRDAAVKLLALKAVWQVRRLAHLGRPVIIFFDEPALAGFGTSEFISVSREDVSACLAEVIEAVHVAGGIAGVHICANTDWSLVLDSSADIVNFDAYAFFDRFVLYPELIRRFVSDGKILAWGIVPTGNRDDIVKETADSLAEKWYAEIARVEALGIDRRRIVSQSLITPSCGAGTLPLELAEKVLQLTREVSDRVRATLGLTETSLFRYIPSGISGARRLDDFCRLALRAPRSFRQYLKLG